MYDAIIFNFSCEIEYNFFKHFGINFIYLLFVISFIFLIVDVTKIDKKNAAKCDT